MMSPDQERRMVNSRLEIVYPSFLHGSWIVYRRCLVSEKKDKKGQQEREYGIVLFRRHNYFTASESFVANAVDVFMLSLLIFASLMTASFASVTYQQK
mmetsp:Transcript_20650/g.23656  ORF Transcript_20650/g.23656 Transcript_20650/m.23656 type:complete len:98 (+) Transcript_20650:230-523(+)